MEITFLGAAGTVTGSKYLLRTSGRTLLVDCGMFQGDRELRLRNREPLPFAVRELDAVVLTHAHMDHAGYLPVLARDGFDGPVYCTEPTADLCDILLRDSARLQEEDADFANRHGYSRHHPALPLYTARDAVRALSLLRPVPMGAPVDAGGGVELHFVPAGHILGAASVRVRTGEGTVVFSGDIGTPDPMLPPPAHPGEGDWLLVESTYGDRMHGPADPADELAQVVTRTAARGGAVVVPAFAVGRAQTLLHLLARLRREGRIPRIPIFMDSPMAARAMGVMRRHPGAHRLSAEEAGELAGVAEVVESAAESRRVMMSTQPRVIVSASGMATGGRVLHHLRHLLPDARNAVLFAGYQAPGTRGAELVAGATTVAIQGEQVPVRAEVQILETLSAHADQGQLMDWLRRFARPPRRTFIVHGEPAASAALRQRIETELGWSAHAPAHGERVELA